MGTIPLRIIQLRCARAAMRVSIHVPITGGRLRHGAPVDSSDAEHTSRPNSSARRALTTPIKSDCAQRLPGGIEFASARVHGKQELRGPIGSELARLEHRSCQRCRDQSWLREGMADLRGGNRAFASARTRAGGLGRPPCGASAAVAGEIESSSAPYWADAPGNATNRCRS